MYIPGISQPHIVQVHPLRCGLEYKVGHIPVITFVTLLSKDDWTCSREPTVRENEIEQSYGGSQSSQHTTDTRDDYEEEDVDEDEEVMLLNNDDFMDGYAGPHGITQQMKDAIADRIMLKYISSKDAKDGERKSHTTRNVLSISTTTRNEAIVDGIISKYGTTQEGESGDAMVSNAMVSPGVGERDVLSGILSRYGIANNVESSVDKTIHDAKGTWRQNM